MPMYSCNNCCHYLHKDESCPKCGGVAKQVWPLPKVDIAPKPKSKSPRVPPTVSRTKKTAPSRKFYEQ